MKIILFTPNLYSGGAQRVAILLASAFSFLDHEVVVAAPSENGELVREISARCGFVNLGGGKPIKSTRQLAELVRRTSPDAVICFGIYAGIAAAISKTFYRWQPIIVIRNESVLPNEWRQGSLLNRIIGPRLSRWAARRTHIVAVSRALAPPTSRYLRIDQTQVTSILNPVIDDTYKSVRPGIRNTSLHPWLQNSSFPTFVAMGRLESPKGFDTLINAFALVRDQADARLVIFGKGGLHDALQAQINAAGLQETIVLAGYTANPIEQMGAAHAFVLSSRFEGFGLVLIEALWAGTQVISTNCDYGPAELLENGRYGTLVPVDDPAALASAMLDSINERRINQRPPDTWFEQFTAMEAARQHIALIESLV